jgi:hypothetical protein
MKGRRCEKRGNERCIKNYKRSKRRRGVEEEIKDKERDRFVG